MKKIKYIFIGLILATTLAYAEGQLVELDPLRNGILSSVVTVDDSADPLPATALSGRKSIIIKNTSATVCYVGHSGVTTANGYLLNQYDSISIDASDDIVVYAIVAAAGSANLRILEVR